MSGVKSQASEWACRRRVIFRVRTGLISCNTYSNVHGDMQKWHLNCSSSKFCKTSGQSISPRSVSRASLRPVNAAAGHRSKVLQLSSYGGCCCLCRCSAFLLLACSFDINADTAIIIMEQSLASEALPLSQTIECSLHVCTCLTRTDSCCVLHVSTSIIYQHPDLVFWILSGVQL